VRHNFLLDENILYHAIRGVDRHDNPDDTAARLIRTIVEVCHSLVVHDVVRVRYLKKLDELKRVRAPHLPPSYFFNQLLNRADKRTFGYDDLPPLPERCSDVHWKDRDLVRAAMISPPLFVTGDEPLYKALKNHPELGIKVLWPEEALLRAQEQPNE
jgi:hypothetical protein